MVKLVSNAAAVIHTAGQVGVTTYLTDPRRNFETNMIRIFNVLEACRKSERNPAVTVCSTNKVYGEIVNRLSAGMFMQILHSKMDYLKASALMGANTRPMVRRSLRQTSTCRNIPIRTA